MFLKEGTVKQKEGAITIKTQYFGVKSLESSIKSVSTGRAVAPTASAVDLLLNCALFASINRLKIKNNYDITYLNFKGGGGCPDCTTVDPPLIRSISKRTFVE